MSKVDEARAAQQWHSQTINTSAPLTGFWYSAVLSSKIKPGMMKAQTLLSMPLVICRNRQGDVAAFLNLCPHRAMPLSFGCFDGQQIECSYHGWQFDTAGTCQHIPSLVKNGALKPEKIGLKSYPCRDQDGYIWVYVPDSAGIPAPMPDVPRLPLSSPPYRLFHISTTLNCTVDNAIVGLMDPAHGPFVHRACGGTRGTVFEKSEDI